MAVSLTLAFLLPIALMILLRVKKKANFPPFFIGAAVMLVFALIIEALIHQVVFMTSFGKAIQANIYLYALYGGLMAGLFEETGRYVAMKTLLKKYRDYETSPANEKYEDILFRFNQPQTTYYFIEVDSQKVGVIRIVDFKDESTRKRISPIFIMSEYRNKGYAQQAIAEAERLHGAENWSLDTILQEEGNCYLYEKLGYRKTGRTEKINYRLTLVFYEKD